MKNNFDIKDIICNNNINSKNIKHKREIELCNYCNYPTDKNKLLLCSSKNCNIKICKGCSTFINNIPFCPTCVLNLMKRKNLLIITSPIEVKE